MINKYNIIITILAIVFLLFGLHQMNQKHNAELQRNNTNDFLSDTISYYNDKLGNEIATKTSLAGDKKQLEVLLSKQIDSTSELKSLIKQYKKTISAGIVQTVTKIDTLRIPYDSVVPFEFEREFKFNNKDYKIVGIASNKEVTINEFELYNKMSFVIGIKDNGLFKKNTYSIDVKNSNPYIKTIGADSYIWTPDIKKWSVGPYIGYDIINNNIGIGISLQYSLFKF